MKKIICFLLCAGMMLPSLAQTFSYGYEGQKLGYTVQESDPTTVYVSKYYPDYEAEDDEELGHPKINLIVPATVTNDGISYRVTGIAKNAIRGTGTKWIVSVVLPDNLTFIGEAAFGHCTNLMSITLPPSLKSIGKNAFEICYPLQEISIPAGVESIGSGAFSGCDLQKVEFASMESLLNINFESNPLSVGHKLYIAGEYISDLVIPDDVTAIGNRTFEGGDFNSVEIPASVKSIGIYAFHGCKNLTSLRLPNSVISIGGGAFQGCTGLTSLTIPNSVETIGNTAFMDCSMESIVIEEGPKLLTVGKLALPDYSLRNLYVGRPHSSNLMQRYSALETLTLGNCVKEVLDSEFAGFQTLTKVTFGSNIESIGEHAFEGCKGLTQVVLPPSVQTIKTGAFAKTGITDVVIGYGIHHIETDAFVNSPVSSLAITAQDVPAVGENIFSNYDFKFMVDGESAKKKFADSANFWGRLESDLLTAPTYLRNDGPNVINGNEYDVITLSATVRPEEASLPYVFWNTTDPEVATVTTDGVVTLQPGVTAATDLSAYYITAETLYANTKKVEVRILNSAVPGGVEETGIEESAPAVIDYSAPYEVYGLDGRLAGTSTEGLANGIYILRQGNVAKKVVVSAGR
ncbi:MAG: leucine-rich repeat domain-containing protein [Muribaculaceae bacterium]|nr:leucine-rich repeat domain-containing protein [Muribaculaceae bacterium]